jgi:hypothetical protein
MVPSSTITIAADGEHLTCGGFSLGETICLGNFEFITDYFNGLSLSPDCFHGLNSQRGIDPVVGHDRGLR